MNRLKLIALSVIIFVFVFFSNTTVAEAASENSILLYSSKTEYDDSSFYFNKGSELSLEIYDYTNDRVIYFNYQNKGVTGASYWYSFKSFTYIEYGEGLGADFDIYILENGVRKYHIFLDDLEKSLSTSTGLKLTFSDFTEIIELPEGDTPSVSIDMTETNNMLKDIKESILIFTALFVFYFGYKIVKEIIYVFDSKGRY